jgi:predicted deacetylase
MWANYLVRFDDICPGMNWEVWNEIEKTCIENNVKPLLAVVPENQDPKLNVTLPPVNEEFFWGKVRQWQEMGWSIAMHGYQHVYATQSASIVKINNYSEFAGLDYETQFEKLKKGREIFRKNNVVADLWIAPAHSFDRNTLQALKNIDINVVSDGFYLFPFKDAQGFKWVPQQIWRYRKQLIGTWTVCFHHNKWTARDLAEFKKLARHKRILGLKDLNFKENPVKKILNVLFHHSYEFVFALRKSLYAKLKR